MALFKNDGAWVEIGDLSIKKEKIVSVSKSVDLDSVLVRSDNTETWNLSFKDHGSDNSQSDYESYVSFIKGLFSTVGGTTSTTPTSGTSTNRDVNTNIVKATSTEGVINDGEFFILEIITDDNGSKSYTAITSGGARQTNVPTWTANVTLDRPSVTSTKNVLDVTNTNSFLLVDENIRRKELAIRNQSDEEMYITFTQPATYEDAIRVQSKKTVFIDDSTAPIYAIMKVVGKVSIEELSY